jgi:hypothetical protein
MPSAVLWIMAALFGIPALYDLGTELTTAPLEDVLTSICSLAVGAFMLYCALKARAGKRAELERGLTVKVGNACVGLFVLCFLAKVGATALDIFA